MLIVVENAAFEFAGYGHGSSLEIGAQLVISRLAERGRPRPRRTDQLKGGTILEPSRVKCCSKKTDRTGAVLATGDRRGDRDRARGHIDLASRLLRHCSLRLLDGAAVFQLSTWSQSRGPFQSHTAQIQRVKADCRCGVPRDFCHR
jgi:hypothetical protein